MNVLIKSAKIIDSNSPFNGKNVDILIEKGIIHQIDKSIKNDKNYKEISFKNLHVSAGWMDMRVNFCDPGHEYKEDLTTGLKAAALGGFTEVVTMPDTNPVTDSKAGIEYLINKSKGNLVTLYPTGSLSHQCEGKDIAEMYDMYSKGAVAFTDNKKSIANPSLLTRALLYNQSFGGLVMNFPNDELIYQKGQMNEGIVNTHLGLKGIPALAEELMVSRDIYLAEYCGARLHLTNISTKKSVELIRDAKKKGIKITADTNSYHLLLNESELTDFNTNFKVMPPLRTKDDINALIKGLKDGTIDTICSDHTPEDIENKQCEFDYAAFGIINLQTSFAVCLTALNGKLELEELIKKITINPRNILQLKQAKIKEGATANITLFNPTGTTTLTKEAIVSKSKNTPFIGKKLRGEVYGVINNDKALTSK